jgi:hypothetical protein
MFSPHKLNKFDKDDPDSLKNYGVIAHEDPYSFDFGLMRSIPEQTSRRDRSRYFETYKSLDNKAVYHDKRKGSKFLIALLI